MKFLCYVAMITLTNNAAETLGVILDSLTDFSNIELGYGICVLNRTEPDWISKAGRTNEAPRYPGR